MYDDSVIDDEGWAWAAAKMALVKGRRYTGPLGRFQGGDHIFAGAHCILQSKVREPESG